MCPRSTRALALGTAQALGIHGGAVAEFPDSPQPKSSLNRAMRKTFDYQPTDISCNIAQLREEQRSPNYVMPSLRKLEEKAEVLPVLKFMSLPLVMDLLKF